MAQILDNINKPNDIKYVNSEDYKKLTDEIRHFLIKHISKTGGHLASNLGTVELTIALHLCMNFPQDKLIWDVGHQAYTHKILTGRKNEFNTLRTYQGLSGFPKVKESECDCFDTGHSSTSISAAMGIVKARDIRGENNKVVAVIGDGALSGGMAFEALNNAARLNSNLMIVLNDNNMSISENVGGMANYLGKLRTDSLYHDIKSGIEKTLNKIPGVGSVIMDKLRKSKDSIKRLVIPGMLFEDMGITYIGPIDGHDIDQLKMAFLSASKVKEAVLVHVITKKGKGYRPAEQNPSSYHGVEAFDVKTGKNNVIKKEISYTEVFSESIVELAKEHDDVVAITAAMPSGTGLSNFMKQFPNRFFDVGIAEEHAVTFGAGLAAGGMKPFVAIYSTFLQRAYDQILHDVCITKLPVVFVIDRAGLVGNDGETHQGIYDISFLSHIPSLTFIAPKNKSELQDMLHFAYEFQGPIAIRYPRGKAYTGLEDFKAPIEYGKSEVLYSTFDDVIASKKKARLLNDDVDKLNEDVSKTNEDLDRSKEEISVSNVDIVYDSINKKDNILLLAVGSMVETAVSVRELLIESNKNVTLVNVRFISPMDEKLLHEMTQHHSIWVTLEENVKAGGYGEKVSSFVIDHNYVHVKHINISLPTSYIEHGDVAILKEKVGFDAVSIYKKVIDKI